MNVSDNKICWMGVLLGFLGGFFKILAFFPTGAESTGTYQSCTDSKKSFTGFVGLYFGEATMVEIKSEICNTDDCNAQLTWSSTYGYCLVQ